MAKSAQNLKLRHVDRVTETAILMSCRLAQMCQGGTERQDSCLATFTSATVSEEKAFRMYLGSATSYAEHSGSYPR
jgi:hypothetical protein